MKPVLLLPLAAALAALFTACSRQDPATAPAAAPAAAVTQAGVGGPAPAWTLPDPDGKQVSFSDFKGKVVVVDFWATWCPPCKTEMPGYIELQKKYAGDVVFVGISVDGDPSRSKVKAFMKTLGINYPIVMADDDIQTRFKLNQGYPTTYIIDRNGIIRSRKVGGVSKAEFEKSLLAVLNPPSV